MLPLPSSPPAIFAVLRWANGPEWKALYRIQMDFDNQKQKYYKLYGDTRQSEAA
jgi:hypothetical protein